MAQLRAFIFMLFCQALASAMQLAPATKFPLDRVGLHDPLRRARSEPPHAAAGPALRSVRRTVRKLLLRLGCFWAKKAHEEHKSEKEEAKKEELFNPEPETENRVQQDREEERKKEEEERKMVEERKKEEEGKKEAEKRRLLASFARQLPAADIDKLAAAGFEEREKKMEEALKTFSDAAAARHGVLEPAGPALQLALDLQITKNVDDLQQGKVDAMVKFSDWVQTGCDGAVAGALAELKVLRGPPNDQDPQQGPQAEFGADLLKEVTAAQMELLKEVTSYLGIVANYLGRVAKKLTDLQGPTETLVKARELEKFNQKIEEFGVKEVEKAAVDVYFSDLKQAAYDGCKAIRKSQRPGDLLLAKMGGLPGKQ